MINSTPSIEVVQHAALTPLLIGELRSFFGAEYLADYGEWDAEQPYGYAPHDVHVISRLTGDVVGHAGWGRRMIAVGTEAINVAGTGGVLVADDARGMGIGEQLMHALRLSMLEDPDIQFGYLGCREAVVPFYRHCGWQRVFAKERSVSRDGQIIEDPSGQPLFVLPLFPLAGVWPQGTIDLRGRPW